MSSINRTCAAHRAVYITNCVPPTSLQSTHRRCWASHTWTNNCGKTFNRSVDSCNKVLLWRNRSIIHHTLHIIPQIIVERCQNWWSCWPWNWSPSTNPSICICNVEVMLHTSVSPQMAVLGHQNEWEQIVTPVRSQTSMLHSTQTMLFWTGVPSWTMISLPSSTTY